jgi:hypothetical protein
MPLFGTEDNIKIDLWTEFNESKKSPRAGIYRTCHESSAIKGREYFSSILANLSFSRIMQRGTSPQLVRAVR